MSNTTLQAVRGMGGILSNEVDASSPVGKTGVLPYHVLRSFLS